MESKPNIKHNELMMHYYVMQVNGQRIIQNKKCSKCVMPSGSEIFIGKLPKNVYEDTLYEMFSCVGNIFKIRIMLDFTGLTRGYAFITYFSKQEADLAVKILNNYRLGTTKIAVHKSVDNRRLYVGGLPNFITRDMVLEEMSNLVDDVVDVIMYTLPHNARANRGYAFVEFSDHRAASIAKRKLTSGNLYLWDAKIYTDWAQPEPDVDSEEMSKVTKLYLSNLDANLSYYELRSFLERRIKPTSITKVHKSTHYAFVHFLTRQVAEDAFAALTGLSIKGRALSVEWARPPAYSKTNLPNIRGDTFCVALPFQRKRNRLNIGLSSSDEASSAIVTSGSPSSSGSIPRKLCTGTNYHNFGPSISDEATGTSPSSSGSNIEKMCFKVEEMDYEEKVESFLNLPDCGNQGFTLTPEDFWN